MIIRGEINDSYGQKLIVYAQGEVYEIEFENKNDFVKYTYFERVLVCCHDNDIAMSVTIKRIIYNSSIKIYRDLYKTIADLSDTKYSNIIAYVDDFKPITPTKGTDYLFSLILRDNRDKIELKAFITTEEYAKYLKSGIDMYKRGDTLILKNVKVLKNKEFAIIFKPVEIIKLEFSNFDSYENEIMKLFNSNLSNLKNKILNNKKNCEMVNLRENLFFNILGQVLFIEEFSQSVVCITDYTLGYPFKNGSVDYSKVLFIKLFGIHKEFMKNIRLNGYYYFQNIRMHRMSVYKEAYMHDYLDGGITEITSESNLASINSRKEFLDKEHYKANNLILVENETPKTQNNHPENITLQLQQASQINNECVAIKSDNKEESESENTAADNFECDFNCAQKNSNLEEIEISHDIKECETIPKDHHDFSLQNNHSQEDHSPQNVIFLKEEAASEEHLSNREIALNQVEILEKSTEINEDISREIHTINIEDMIADNIYCIAAKVTYFDVLNNGQGKYSRIIVHQNYRYTLNAGILVTNKLLNTTFLLNQIYKILLYKGKDNQLHVIELFFDENEFKNFELFYIEKLHKLQIMKDK